MTRPLLVALIAVGFTAACTAEQPPPDQAPHEVPPSWPEFARVGQACLTETLDADGFVLSIVANRFDVDGRVVRTVQEDIAAGSLVDTVTFRDADGRLRDVERYTRMPSSRGYGHSHVLYDEAGAPTASREGGFDDRIDILMGSYQVDDRQRITVLDRRALYPQYAADRLENFAYDDEDRLLHYDYDLAIDGNLEMVRDVTYDDLTEIWQHDEGGDRYQQTIERDKFGEVIRWEIDLSVDGTLDYLLTAVLDDEGRILGYQTDADGDGTVEVITTLDADEERRILTSVESDADGVVTGSTVYDYRCHAPIVDAPCGPGFSDGALGCARWRMAAAMDFGRVGHHVLARPDGTLLALGGVGGTLTNSPPITAVETLAVDAAEPVPHTPLATERIWEAAALLPDGRVVVAGGCNGADDRADVRVYDPEGVETAGPPLAVARRRAQVVVFDDGEVLLAGGFDADSDHRSAERFQVDDAATAPAGSWRSVHRDATLTRVDSGRAIAVGGLTNGNAVSDETEVFERSQGRWVDGPNLAVARKAHAAAVLSNGRLIVVGGEDANGRPLADVEILNVDTMESTLAAPLPEALADLHVVVLPGDIVLVAGGRTEDGERAGASAATYVYDLASDSWGLGPVLNVERYAGRLVALPDGRAAMVGGSVEAAQTTAAVEILELAP